MAASRPRVPFLADGSFICCPTDDSRDPPSIDHLSTCSPFSIPRSPPFTPFFPPTGCIKSTWPKITRRTPRCRNLVQSSTFEGPSHSYRWSLRGNSFQHTRRIFIYPEVDFNLSTKDESASTLHEGDLVEGPDISPNIITIVVRPLPFASTTHLTRTFPRRFCFLSSVGHSPICSTDS